jgi:hypothetical protein
MREFPRTPGNDALLRARLVREHRDVLQQVTVGVVKEDGRGRHPGEDHRLICRLPVEVEWDYTSTPQRARGCHDVCEARAKRGV